MQVRSMPGVVAGCVALWLVLRAVACLLTSALPGLVAVFVMLVAGRLVWFYTR